MVSRNDCSTIARAVEIGGTLGVVWSVVGVEELCKNCLLGYTELQYSILIEYKTIGKFYSKIVFYVGAHVAFFYYLVLFPPGALVAAVTLQCLFTCW